MDAITELKEKYKLGILSQSECLLIAIVLFCLGLILGMIFSPKGNRAYGSNNSNNGNNNGPVLKDDTDSCDEE